MSVYMRSLRSAGWLSCALAGVLSVSASGEEEAVPAADPPPRHTPTEAHAEPAAAPTPAPAQVTPPLVAAPKPPAEPAGRKVPPLSKEITERTHPRYLMDLADVELRYNSLERAEELLKRALEFSAREEDKLLAQSRLAGLLERLQDWPAAIDLYEKLVESEKNAGQKANYAMRLAQMYMRGEQYDKAEALLTPLAGAAPAGEQPGQNDWIPRLANERLMQVWKNQPGRLEAIIKECEDKLAQDPKDIATLDKLSNLYGSVKRDPAKSTEILQKLVELKPDDLDARDKLAASLQASGNLDGALVQYKKLLEAKPGPEGARFSYRAGQMLLQANRKDEAVALVKEHLDQPDAPVGNLNMLAAFYTQAQMTEQAEGVYLKLAEKATQPAQRADFLLRVADMARQAKNYDRSEQQLRAILEQFKDNPSVKARANRSLVQLYEEQGKVGELKIEK